MSGIRTHGAHLRSRTGCGGWFWTDSGPPFRNTSSTSRKTIGRGGPAAQPHNGARRGVNNEALRGLRATGHVAEMDHGGGRRVGMRGLQSRISEVSRVHVGRPALESRGGARTTTSGVTRHYRYRGLRILSGWRANPHYSVRREKAPFLSGCESRPATVAPAGSSRSGRWR